MGDYLGDLIEINGQPLLACLVVSGILVYLGMHVVERKVIFVDLALAQIAALGVMWSILMGYDHENDTLAVTLYSLAFTGVGALVFSITRDHAGTAATVTVSSTPLANEKLRAEIAQLRAETRKLNSDRSFSTMGSATGSTAGGDASGTANERGRGRSSMIVRNRVAGGRILALNSLIPSG